MSEEQPAKSGVQIHWSGRTVGTVGAIFAAIITLISSFTSFAVTHYLDEATVTQRQNDRLDNLDQRLTKLETIAQTNTEARIQMQAELHTFEKDSSSNQQLILEHQQELLELLREHERTTRKRLKEMKLTPTSTAIDSPIDAAILDFANGARAPAALPDSK